MVPEQQVIVCMQYILASLKIQQEVLFNGYIRMVKLQTTFEIIDIIRNS